MQYLRPTDRFSLDDDTQYRLDFLLHDSSLAQGCYGDIPYFSREYLTEVMQAPGVVIKNGSFFNGDFNTRYVNIKQGVRYTPRAPKNTSHTIYILGSSSTFGSLCEDRHTVAAHLQSICNNMLPNKYRVLNYGTRGAYLQLHALQMPYLPVREGDVVFVMGLNWFDNDSETVRNLYLMCQERRAHFCFFLTHTVHAVQTPSPRELLLQSNYYKALGENSKGQPTPLFNDYQPPHGKYVPEPIVNQLAAVGCPCIDLLPVLNRPHDMGEIFIDKVHLCSRGNMAIAQSMYSNYLAVIDQPLDRARAMASSYELFRQWVYAFIKDEPGLQGWLNMVRASEFAPDGKTIGAVVVNCNPFTLGHLYLIEQALGQVDNLYVFVVEEDLSEFKFKDRIALVRQGVAHLGNRVKVFGAGKFIISSKTFPEYFDKTAFVDEAVDTTNDLAIFGVAIAPSLAIGHRFVGQEPYCQVTRQYNESMQRILPNLGVKVTQIARTEAAGQVISASLVRQCIAERNWPTISQLVPPSTYNFLVSNFKS